MKQYWHFFSSVLLLGIYSGNVVAEVTSFGSPSDAVEALSEAASKQDVTALTKIFGEPFMAEINSGDPTADAFQLKRFSERLTEESNLVDAEDGIKILLAGKDKWPFPAPLIEKDDRWAFDSTQGAEEIINRRIGENELRAIKVAEFYVEAQRLYHLRDRTGSGKQQYAQKFLSTNGKKDGLYWPATSSADTSPLGPLVGRAVSQGYEEGTNKKPNGDSLYRGYYYRILKKQGADAPGGAKNYIASGSMTKGFALLAYPARPGVGGIMSFIVGEDGVVYEKDLGEKTHTLVEQIAAFNPDSSWSKVSESES